VVNDEVHVPKEINDDFWIQDITEGWKQEGKKI
jgi:hypothetical protein